MTHLNLKKYSDIDEFLLQTRSILLEKEALNTFFFVMANKLQATKADPSTYYSGAVWNGTEFVLGIIGLRDGVLYVSALYDENKLEAAELLAKEAYASGMNFSHIQGYQPAIGRVGDVLLKESGNKWTIKEQNGWAYDIDKVIWSERDLALVEHGELKLATAEDIPILRKIAYQYIEDLGESVDISKEETNKDVQEALDTHGAYMWVTKEEGPVGMAWVRRPLVKGISISYVAVLPEYRHKGYGSVMVSALTEKLLKDYQYVTLFALINQKVDDNLYTRIGYRYIGKSGMPQLIR